MSAVNVAVADVFTLGVGPHTGAQPIQEVGLFGTASVAMSLDTGPTVTFDVAGDSPGARQIDELATDVWVYLNGATIARCRVASVQQTFGPDGDDTVNVTAVGYEALMTARHVQSPLVYAGVDQAQIVWALIQHTQAQAGGDLGITAGTLDGGSILRDRAYLMGENIADILSNLSATFDGPWWGIDGLLNLNVHPFSTFPTLSTPIMLGVTARSMTRNSGASTFANSVIADGDANFTTPVSVDDAGIAADPRGRWERIAGFPLVTDQSTLVENADGLLQSARSPIASWSCQIDASRFITDAGYMPGDFVKIVVPASTVAPSGVPEFSVDGQVMSMTLTIDASGESSVDVQCVEVAT